MSKRESISRYNIIIKKIRKHPVTLKEIMDYLMLESEIQGYNFNVSQRTFQRDLEEIRSIYNIDIQYDFSRKVYYVDSELQAENSDRILESFDLFNALNVSERLSNFIHFEKRKSIGTEHLYGILHALKNKFQLEFTYRKFLDDNESKRNVAPYALKEFKNRWYLIANDLNDDTIKSFGLDRIKVLTITKKHYEYPTNFNVSEYFKNCFGIIKPHDEEPYEILLSFTSFQGKYIKTMPLHESQEILSEENDELLVGLKLYITHDFVMEILSMGENVKVLKPEILVNQIRDINKSSLEMYNDNVNSEPNF